MNKCVWFVSDNECNIPFCGTLQCYIVKDSKKTNIAFVDDKKNARLISLLPEMVGTLRDAVGHLPVDDENVGKINELLRKIDSND